MQDAKPDFDASVPTQVGHAPFLYCFARDSYTVSILLGCLTLR